MATTARQMVLKITALHEVGNYAAGIKWSDGHDSIYPWSNLRRHCPCLECAKGAHDPDANGSRLRQLMRLGDASLFLGWADGHETIYTLPELRALCGCALCKGEPDKPLTG
jgi:DUF971 family protein